MPAKNSRRPRQQQGLITTAEAFERECEEVKRKCAEYRIPYVTSDKEQRIKCLYARRRDLTWHTLSNELDDTAIDEWNEIREQIDFIELERARRALYEEPPASPAPLEPQQQPRPKTGARRGRIPFDWTPTESKLSDLYKLRGGPPFRGHPHPRWQTKTHVLEWVLNEINDARRETVVKKFIRDFETAWKKAHPNWVKAHP
jgi:hypothetical protein